MLGRGVRRVATSTLDNHGLLMEVTLFVESMMASSQGIGEKQGIRVN